MRRRKQKTGGTLGTKESGCTHTNMLGETWKQMHDRMQRDAEFWRTEANENSRFMHELWRQRDKLQARVDELEALHERSAT